MAMRAQTETVHPDVLHLVTGHYREGRGYATWRAHGTNDWLLILTLDGCGRFGYGVGEVVTEPGDLVLLRPGTLHDYGVEPTQRQWELLWTHFRPRPHWQEWLNWPEEAPGLMRLTLPESELRQTVAAQFVEVHRLAMGAQRHREAFAMNALEALLLRCDTANPRSDSAHIDLRVRRVMDYLSSNLAEKTSLEDLAGIADLSVSRLAHLFRRQVGVTPMQYLEQQRLERARQLLELTPRTVQAIADEVGFDSAFYFSLRFKRYTGVGPRAYRQRAMR